MGCRKLNSAARRFFSWCLEAWTRKDVENPKEMVTCEIIPVLVSFETIGTSRTEARLRGLR